jgi:hypothetical protein
MSSIRWTFTLRRDLNVRGFLYCLKPLTSAGGSAAASAADIPITRTTLLAPESAEPEDSVNPEVERALERAIELRREVLQRIPYQQRILLLEQLLYDFFVEQRASLLKWSALTGQSAQVDTGYIAQHVASIVLCEPGQGFKGKGLDLADSSEVKSAAILSGVDRPRWNHDMGRVADDPKRVAKGMKPKWHSYLNAPLVFYLLFDRVVEGEKGGNLVLRVRAWAIDSRHDNEWRALIDRFLESRKGDKYNLQLHPPVGYDDSVVVNSLGNLDFSGVKVLEARMSGLNEGDTFHIDWVQQPPESVTPIDGRCQALPFRKGARPSRLSVAADMRPDMEAIARLIPGVDLTGIEQASAVDIAIMGLEEENDA